MDRDRVRVRLLVDAVKLLLQHGFRHYAPESPHHLLEDRQLSAGRGGIGRRGGNVDREADLAELRFEDTGEAVLFIAQLERSAGFARDDGPEAKLEKFASLLGPAAKTGDISLLAELMSVPGGERF